MDGFLNVLKPPGMTSSDAVVFVRRMLPRGMRVGHGGTLDPDAAGVLPIMVGRAARLFDYIIDKKKTYIAELCLGIETDTQDSTGRVVRVAQVSQGAEAVQAALPAFIGQIMQRPPDYSAIKQGGQRLYALARTGQEINVAPRPVLVQNLSYIRQSGDGRHMILIECGKGLYVRTLLHDIGQSLGCGGHMSFLLRSRAGYFSVEDARTPDEIARAGQIEPLLVPMDAPLAHIARVDVAAEHGAAIRNGNPIRPGWVDTRLEPGEIARVYCAGCFVGMGESQPDGSIRFRAMLME